MNSENLRKLNEALREKSPIDIIKWGLKIADKPILTTNFGPYSASLIYAVTSVKHDIDVIWCDTGYNTSNTYRFANKMIDTLKLNMDIYIPKSTAAYRDVVYGIPDVSDPIHKEFSEQVKLEPFRRAMKTHQPDVWFTNIRQGQTAYRDTLDIASITRDGVLRIAPFYHWSESELEIYLEQNNLPNELKYFDPTKARKNNECGIQL